MKSLFNLKKFRTSNIFMKMNKICNYTKRKKINFVRSQCCIANEINITLKKKKMKKQEPDLYFMISQDIFIKNN